MISFKRKSKLPVLSEWPLDDSVSSGLLSVVVRIPIRPSIFLQWKPYYIFITWKLHKTGKFKYFLNECLHFFGPMEAPSKMFLLFFLFSNWAKVESSQNSNRTWFFDCFLAIFVTLTETIRVTNYATSFGAKKCS